METLLHLIGICPENFTHFDLIDIITNVYVNIPNAFLRFKLW